MDRNTPPSDYKDQMVIFKYDKTTLDKVSKLFDEKILKKADDLFKEIENIYSQSTTPSPLNFLREYKKRKVWIFLR